MPLEHRERGVLQRGQVGRADDVVERLPDRELHLLDQVEQGDVAVVGRHLGAGLVTRVPRIEAGARTPVDTRVHGRDDARAA